MTSIPDSSPPPCQKCGHPKEDHDGTTHDFYGPHDHLWFSELPPRPVASPSRRADTPVNLKNAVPRCRLCGSEKGAPPCQNCGYDFIQHDPKNGWCYNGMTGEDATQYEPKIPSSRGADEELKEALGNWESFAASEGSLGKGTLQCRREIESLFSRIREERDRARTELASVALERDELLEEEQK